MELLHLSLPAQNREHVFERMKAEIGGGAPSSAGELAAFAGDGENGHLRRLKSGEGLVGQCAAEKRRIVISDLPPQTIPIFPLPSGKNCRPFSRYGNSPPTNSARMSAVRMRVMRTSIRARSCTS